MSGGPTGWHSAAASALGKNFKKRKIARAQRSAAMPTRWAASPIDFEFCIIRTRHLACEPQDGDIIVQHCRPLCPVRQETHIRISQSEDTKKRFEEQAEIAPDECVKWHEPDRCCPLAAHEQP